MEEKTDVFHFSVKKKNKATKIKSKTTGQKSNHKTNFVL